MKAFKNIKGFFMTLMAASVLSTAVTSCDNDLNELITDDNPNNQEKTIVMHFDGAYPSYNMQTRSTSAEWNNGDIIFLRFYLGDGTSVICGKAVYNATTSAWQMSYYGNITVGSKCKCQAFFFTNATIEDNYNIKMTAMSGVYLDENAYYIVEDGELYVNATLSPKTARMRIKGSPSKKIIIKNVKYNASFNLTNNEFIDGNDSINATFGDDSYTPYVYIALNEDNKITLCDAYWQYTKTFDSSKFAPGESGYVTMPSQEENKGWTPVFYYPEEAVDLGLSVRWASMNIGATTAYEAGILCSWGDAYGTNTSTSSSYNSDLHSIAGNAEYDIATRLWGERWQIPTKEQWQELLDNCTWTYNGYNSETGVYSYTFTSKNGNSICLPMYNYSSTPTGTTTSSIGYYWTSTEYSSNYYNGYCFKLGANNSNISYEYKYYHMAIRPVLVK